MEETTKIEAGQNRDIESFLANAGALEIDFDFGLNEYFRYLEDLRLLSLGLPFSDIGISERRHSALPKLITPSESANGFRFVDSWDVYDPSVTPVGSIALLKLNGVMRAQSGISSPGVDRMVNDLRAAYANQNVSGVIIETNSGGGESMAGNILQSAIQERNKPVVGFGHLVASAAYRALSAADEIIASGPGAEFGSIGTMITMDAKTLNKYRERFSDFYGSGAPGKNQDFRQAIAGDYSGIQKRVDGLTASFQNNIRSLRPLRGSESRISETLNGSVYDAMDSKSRGLVDMIGTMQTAVKRINALKGKY